MSIEHAVDPAILAGEEVLSPHDERTESSVQAEMGRLFNFDRTMALLSMTALIVAIPFFYFTLLQYMPGAATKVVLAAAAVVLVIYNGASMAVLIRNYRRNFDYIYRRDVAHLREIREARREGKVV